MNLKLKIGGMHCESCVKLIKQNLENQSGVTNAKVDLKSEIALIDFDPEKIKKEDLFNVIKISGDYKIQELESEVKNNVPAAPGMAANQNNSFNMFVWGLLGGLVVMSMLLNVVFGIMLSKAK